MKKKLSVSLAVVGLVACAALYSAGPKAQAADKRKALSDSDLQFVMKAAAGGMSEVELGKLAEKNGASPDVKKFGARMVEDHSKANSELAGIARENDVTLATELKGKHKEMYDKLAAQQTAEFDKHYMHHMLMDHVEDVADFSKEAQNGENPQLKQFAAKTLQVIQEHLALAKEIAPKVGAEMEDSKNAETK